MIKLKNMLLLVFESFICLSLALLWYASPILKPFPPLTGSHKVGLQELYFIDQKRDELFSDNPPRKRAIVTHIFYPAHDVSTLKKAAYLESKLPLYQKAIAANFGISELIVKPLLANIQTNIYMDAPLSTTASNYPVILFSHGLLGESSDMYQIILADLATNGYIVVGIDHPYFNMFTVYPDGSVISSQKLDEQFQAMSPKEQKEFQTKAIEIYKADMQFVIDQLTLIHQTPDSILYNHLDLDRIGVMGHSAGGTAAIEICRTDNRCKAAVDLDGWYDQVIGNDPVQQPLLLMFGSKSIEVTEPTAEYLKRKQLTREQYFERERTIEEHKKQLCTTSNCSMIIIPGAQHGDFGDFVLLKWPLRAWKAADAYDIMKQVNGHILSFFATYLK